jgi:DNA polymerase-3 subunit gamma/tau
MGQAQAVAVSSPHCRTLPADGPATASPARLWEPATPSGAAPGQAPPPNGGGLRAVAGGGAVMAAAQPVAAPVAVPAIAQPSSWREVVALASGKDPKLHADLRFYAHPVRVTPGHIELRPAAAAPRDLSPRLVAFLHAATGTRWTVSLVNAGGEPTLAEQGRSAEQDRLALAHSHPLVQAVLQAFPGATIEMVRDAALDAYGLPPPSAGGDTDDGRDFAEMDPGRDFAPPDAEPAGLDDDMTEED